MSQCVYGNDMIYKVYNIYSKICNINTNQENANYCKVSILSHGINIGELIEFIALNFMIKRIRT